MRTEHRLRDGDTLESIATRYYGDPRRADDIFEANRNLLPSRNLLPLNVTIKLPSRDSLPPISDPSNAPRASPKTRTTLGSVR
jgi:nucleoid-associated protein YgaU